MSVKVLGATKNYGRVTALDNVSLYIAGGEFITLLGPSGSGKTTLLMILGGFVRPTCGEIHFGDHSVVRLPPHRRNLGVVFQNYALFPHMNVFDNIAFPLRLRRIQKEAIAERVEWALGLVRLNGYGSRRIDQLSGGQCQRVALARAIVFKPSILLMDEPLSALDKKLREHMQVEIRALHEQLGVTTIYVTHDQREALTMSDRVAVLREGRLMQLDAPRTLYQRPENAFVADFVGESSFVRVRSQGEGVSLNGQALKLTSPLPGGDAEPYLLLRPERIRIIRSDGERNPDFNHLTGTVRRAVFQGESILLYVCLDTGDEVTVRDLIRSDSPGQEFSAGDKVTLGIHRNDTLVTRGSAA